MTRLVVAACTVLRWGLDRTLGQAEPPQTFVSTTGEVVRL